MDEAVAERLFEVEAEHWWCVARRQIVAALLHRFLPPRPGGRARVGELGCGGGQTLSDLSARYDVRGMDPSPLAIRSCRRRGVAVLPGRLPDAVPFAPGSLDAVLLLDVLEHVADDGAAVAAAVRCLAPGGVLLATAPACPWLYTERDRRHSHLRRYTQRTFARLFRLPGLTALRLSYFNCFLFPLAGPFRLVPMPRAWGRLDDGLAVPPAPLNRLLTRIFASEADWLTHTSLPIGLSVLCVARRGGKGTADARGKNQERGTADERR